MLRWVFGVDYKFTHCPIDFASLYTLMYEIQTKENAESFEFPSNFKWIKNGHPPTNLSFNQVPSSEQ